MADGIIGSVGVSVVPDATAFWDRFRAQTAAGAAEAGRKAGNDWQRGFETGAHGTSVKVNADTSKARAEIAALNRETSSGKNYFGSLIQAAISVAPALVPLGAAAGLAGAQLAAMGATGILAFKGISAELKTATPQGFQAAQMVGGLTTSLDKLQHTAARAVMPGFTAAVAQLQHELPQVNRLVASQGQLLGGIAAHLTGGLVGGFKTFAPLLNQVALSADKLAAHFEAWATGPGGVKFAQTLSSDYRRVVPVIDDIAKAAEHLIVAAHPVGLGILTELQLLARVVSAFPVPVLEAMTAAFVAQRTIATLRPIYTAVAGAYTSMTTALTSRGAAAAAAQEEFAAVTAASQAQAAAAVATAQADEAEATAAAQADIAASLEGTGSILEASAAQGAAYAAEMAASFRAAATAAQASAAEMSAAAEEATAASAAAGAEGGFAFSSLLGPLGIAVGAVGLLGLSFLGTSEDTQKAQQAVEGFTQALIQSNGAINDNVQALVAKNLADEGSLQAATTLGINPKTLVDAVTGPQKAFDSLLNSLARLRGGFDGLILEGHLQDMRREFLAGAQSAKLQSQALDGTTAALKRYDLAVEKHLNARVAMVQAEDSFISAARAVEDAAAAGGRNLNVLTAKGQATRDALIGAAQAALSFYDAQIKANVPPAKAAAILAADVKQLEQTAIHAGLTKGPVDKLLKSLGLFPRTIVTKFETPGVDTAMSRVQQLFEAYARASQMGLIAPGTFPLPDPGTSTTADEPPPNPGLTGSGGVIPKPGYPTPTPPSTSTVAKLAQQQAGFGSALQSFFQSVTGGAQNPITAAFNQLIASVRQGGGKLSTAFVDSLRADNNQLRVEAKRRDQIATELQHAQQRLANLRQSRTQEISTVKSAITGTFDITTAGQNQYGEPVTLFDIQGSLKLALRNATQFEHVLKRLAREGLNKALVAQLAEAGPQALPQAQALLSATPKQLAQINSEYRQLGGVGKDLGKFVGNDLYKAGIQAADGLIKGLRSKEHALAVTMRHLASVMVNELRRELGMRSPSRKLFDEAALAFEGYRLGIESKADDIAKAAGYVAGKALGNGSAYKFDGLSLHGGAMVAGDFNVHQHFDRPVPEPPSRSQQASMRAARNALGAR